MVTQVIVSSSAPLSHVFLSSVLTYFPTRTSLPPSYEQDILLMKGEGEVKLNMTVGKGEQVLKHHSEERQQAIRSQLQSLKDAWANMLMTSMSCHR